MEALWSLEDKWKLSTQKAIALFACTSLLVIGVCVAGALARRKTRKRGSVLQEACKDDTLSGTARAEPPVYPGRCSVMKALVRSARWSGPSKWEESLRGSQREAPTPLLVKRDLGGPEVGWQSHNSTSAVWQRPILMGEKCELPRFSGLIPRRITRPPFQLHLCKWPAFEVNPEEPSSFSFLPTKPEV